MAESISDRLALEVGTLYIQVGTGESRILHTTPHTSKPPFFSRSIVLRAFCSRQRVEGRGCQGGHPYIKNALTMKNNTAASKAMMENTRVEMAP